MIKLKKQGMPVAKTGVKDIAKAFWNNPTLNLSQAYEDQFGRYANFVTQEINQLQNEENSFCQLFEVFSELDTQIKAEKSLHNEFKVHYDNISTHFSQLRHKTEGVSETDIQNNAK